MSDHADQRWLDNAVPPPGDAAPALVLAAFDNPSLPDDRDELLSLIRTALASPQRDRSAGALASELARAFGCDRVFVGIAVRRFVQVIGLSHGSALGPDVALARSVGAAMDEAVDQGASILHPQHPNDRPRITLAAASLAARGNGLCVLTVPLFDQRQPVGALTFERPLAARFDADTVRRIEAVAAALAPLLELKFGRERSAWQRARESLRRRVAALGWSERVAWAGAALLGTVALVGLLAWPWAYRINAPTRLEGRVQRALVAPVDGFLKSALVRPGDTVREGQLLAELSDDDLRLERQRWASEVDRHENTYAEAQAKADRTQMVIAGARVAESRAQLALVDQQLGRTQLRAPFDGLVIQGDLNRQLGAPVKRGDALLTLTPSRELRVMLELDERDVGQIEPGARGAVTLSALPEHSFGFVVERVMPVARPEAGRNLFEAEARLDPNAIAATGSAAALRPGLLGLARIDAGERSLAWQASHRVIDWLRLQWWSWRG